MAAINSEIILTFVALSTVAAPVLRSLDFDKYRISLNPPAIAIRFSHQPRNSKLGFTFGRNDTCDFPFRQQNGISQLHFHITFNTSSGCPILIDNSSFGTVVKSKTTGNRKLRHSHTPIFTEDIIQFGMIMLKLLLPSADEDEYKRNWQTYKRHSLATLPSFDALNLQSQSTTVIDTHFLSLLIDDTEHETAGTRPKAADHLGNMYAVKSRKPSEEGLPRLLRELKTLRDITHPHIITIVTDKYLKPPGADTHLITELPPFGDLEYQNSLNMGNMTTIVQQVLHATVHLHENDIFHLNLRPANILIFSKDPVQIKLGDFSCAGTDACSRAKHSDMAPEMLGESLFDKKDADISSCTAAVDIWSIGLIVLRFSILGPWRRQISLQELKKQFSRPGWQPLTDLANLMLQPEVHQRPSAKICLEEISRVVAEPSSPNEQYLINLKFLQEWYEKTHSRKTSILRWINIEIHQKPTIAINLSRICDEFKLSPNKRRLIGQDLHGKTHYNEAGNVYISLSDMSASLNDHSKDMDSITNAAYLQDLEQELQNVHLGSQSDRIYIIP